MRRRVRAITGVLSIALVAGMLGGCHKDPVSQPVVSKKSEAYMSVEQYERIVQSTLNVIDTADESFDEKTLATRLTGPALTQRAAQYKLEKLKNNDSIPPIVIDTGASPMISGGEYPRSLVAYSPPAEGQNQHTLSVWKQQTARDNYHLWGQVVLNPAQEELPEITSVLSGDTDVHELDPADYLVDPATVGTAYATFLTERQASGVTFSDGDELYTRLGENLTVAKESLGEAGSATITAKDSGETPLAIPTKDGGIVVFSSITYDFTLSVTGDDAITFSREDGPLMYTSDPEKTTVKIEEGKPFTEHYSVVVAFYIPPKITDKQTDNKGDDAHKDAPEASQADGQEEKDSASKPAVVVIGASKDVLTGANVGGE